MDTVARYGGEEFIIITPEKSAGAQMMAERIRTTVAERSFADGTGSVFNLTISIGLVSYPNHAIEAAELINKADKALYLAKEQGRNRVCIASDLPTPNKHAKVIHLDNPPAHC